MQNHLSIVKKVQADVKQRKEQISSYHLSIWQTGRQRNLFLSPKLPAKPSASFTLSLFHSRDNGANPHFPNVVLLARVGGESVLGGGDGGACGLLNSILLVRAWFCCSCWWWSSLTLWHARSISRRSRSNPDPNIFVSPSCCCYWLTVETCDEINILWTLSSFLFESGVVGLLTVLLFLMFRARAGVWLWVILGRYYRVIGWVVS